MKAEFRGRVWYSGGMPATGEGVLLFDTYQADPVGEAVTDAMGVWAITADVQGGPYFAQCGKRLFLGPIEPLPGRGECRCV